MQYKIIPGFSLYRVSRCGAVVGMRGRIMHPETDKDGYKRIRVRRDSNGKKRRAGVHDLVLRAWDREPVPGEVPNHKNGIKDDNRLENLEWVTLSENVQHGYDIGLHRPQWKGVSGKRHPSWGHIGAGRVRIDVAGLVANLLQDKSIRQAAIAVGANYASAKQLVNGKHWQSEQFKNMWGDRPAPHKHP